jgi:hypothetical protein
VKEDVSLQLNSSDQDLQHLVERIRARGEALDTGADKLRSPAIIASFDPWSAEKWCRAVAGDSLVRLRQLTEQSFHFVETMGVVSVARYTFELALWLRLFALNRDYGLVYYDQLIATQRRFYQDSLGHLEKEVEWLRGLGDGEQAARDEVLAGVDSSAMDQAASAQLVEALQKVSDDVDAEAARHFSLYADDAKHNGYAYQAHMVEEQAIPPLRKILADIDVVRGQFEERAGERIQDLRLKRWQWKEIARRVGPVDEYDYLYAFASKLLHATPASITTDQKNLEVPEMLMFLKYVDVTMGDILDLAKEYEP